jgi:nicotinamide mononucleotide transporter
MTSTISRRQQLLGTKAQHAENLRVTLFMLLVTLMYQAVSAQLIPEFQFNWFEFIGTWSGLVTVWLARTENILSWPWGIVSAATLGYFFASIGLVGQQWLNWGYFLIIQLWAWPHWAFGGVAKSTLPITRFQSAWGWIGTIGVIGVGTLIVYSLIALIAPASTYPVIDAIVVASSITAQFLLGRKKLESWFLWLGPVNVLSIILFALSGAYIVMALYVAFFIHAIFALRSWRLKSVVTQI